MTTARQLLVAALAAATLVITAAPAMPAAVAPAPAGPDLSEYSWKPIYGATNTALSMGLAANAMRQRRVPAPGVSAISAHSAPPAPILPEARSS